MSAVVYVNEAMAVCASPRDVAELYAAWALHRRGVRGGGLTAWTVVECSDDDHAREVREMLLGWGLPANSVRLRRPAKAAIA